MLFQKLQAWQDDEDVSDTELAARITKSLQCVPPVHQSTISRAKRGLRVIGMEQQLAIQKITKKVSPADWAEFYAQTVHLRGKSAKRAQKKSVEAAA